MPDRRPLRAAIIGTGRIASRLEKDPLRSKPHSHAGWYAAHPRTTLVAGADVDETALTEFGADWGIAARHLYRDYREMLERERPDLVSVCAYATERVAMCEAAVACGAQGLWVEKPVACSLADAERLARVVERAGALVVVDQPRRADRRYRAVARLIATGELGRLESVHAIFSGSALHTGTHAWDVLDHWCGPWSRLQAWAGLACPEATAGDGRADAWGARRPRGPGELADVGLRAHLEFASGVHAFVSGSAKGYFVFQFDVLLDRGRLQLGNDVWRAWRPAASSRYTGFVELEEIDATTLERDADTYDAPMVFDLVRAIEAGDRPLMSLRHGVESLRTGVGLLQSASAGGGWLARHEVDPHLTVHSR